MVYVTALSATDGDTTSFGGKAASLGAIIKAGFAVPEGFVIGTHATGIGLQELEQEVLSAFDDLGAHKVAVRSSAVAEDSKDASWAGQLETFLNIERDRLIEHIQKCWQSALSDRAKAYAAQHDIDHGKVAVVVQRMINSEVSGVAFSVHPVTQDDSQMIIEAGLGLGEAVVSGEITPDTYVVSKSSLTILDKDISEQEKQLTDQGWVESGSEGTKQKLADEQITELGSLVKKLEQHWGHPVDVEWALEKGKLYITQSRPITTL